MRRNSASLLTLAVALLAVHPLEADEVVTPATGMITVNGQPLAAGKITFYLDDDQFVGSKVKDGAYKVTRVPVGEWTVVIEGDGIPARFADEKTSGFKVSVQPGKNTFEFDIKR